MTAVPVDHTVYAFVSLERGIELTSVAPFKATRDAVESRFGGLVLEGTAEQVDPASLDDLGRYVRRPTGWGDLAD